MTILVIPPSERGYSESRIWVSQVFESMNRTEVRTAQMKSTDIPLRQVEASIVGKDEMEQALLQGIMSNTGDDTLIKFGLWFSHTVTTATATISGGAGSYTSVWTCTTTDREYIVGDQAAILIAGDPLDVVLGTITVVASGSLSVDISDADQPKFPIAAGADVVPIIQGSLFSAPALATTRDKYGIGSVIMREMR